MRQRLSDKLVRDLAAPASGNRIVYDSEVSGFGIRVTAAGAKSFILNYRVGGRERRYTIGAYGPDQWSVAAARKRAGDLRKMVATGEDPLGQRVEDRKAATVRRLAELYVRDHAAGKRDRRGDERMLAQWVVPELGPMKVAELRRADIRELHRKITAAGSPIRANRVLALLSKMLSLAVADYEMRPDNPAKGIPRNPENKRERYLSQAEIVAVSEALARYPSQNAANAVRMLMLTGARKAEVLNMTWGQVDLDRGVWIKPSAHTKQKKEHRVPLSAPALRLLSDIRADQGKRGIVTDYCFPGRDPRIPTRQLHFCWQFVRNETGLHDVRIHDLRHTYASILVSAGLSLPLIGALLGHTQPATTARYAHLFDEPLREATERVGAAIGGAGAAEVVALRKGGGG